MSLWVFLVIPGAVAAGVVFLPPVPYDWLTYWIFTAALCWFLSVAPLLAFLTCWPSNLSFLSFIFRPIRLMLSITSQHAVSLLIWSVICVVLCVGYCYSTIVILKVVSIKDWSKGFPGKVTSTGKWLASRLYRAISYLFIRWPIIIRFWFSNTTFSN